MAIYKSSYKKKVDKKEDIKPETKPTKERKPHPTKKVNINAIMLIVYIAIFIICVLPSNFAKNFILGMVGLLAYPVCLLGIIFSIALLNKRKYNLQKKYLVYLICALLTIWYIFHLVLTQRLSIASYGAFLAESYKAKTTAGGLVLSLFTYPIIKLITRVGAYILGFILLAIFVGLIVDYIRVERNLKQSEKKSEFNFNAIEEFESTEKVVEEPELTPEEKTRKMAKQKLGLEKGESTIISSSMPKYDINTKLENKQISKRDYILTPIEPILPDSEIDDEINFFSEKTYKQKIDQPIENVNSNNISTEKDTNNLEQPTYETNNSIKEELSNETDDFMVDEDEDLSNYETKFSLDATDDTNTTNELDSTDESVADQPLTDVSEYQDMSEETPDQQKFEEEDVDLDETEYIDEYADNKYDMGLGSTVESEVVSPKIDLSKFNLPNLEKREEPKDTQIKLEDVKPKEEIPPYVAPPVSLLNFLDNPVRISDEELQDNIDRLEQVLEDFKVPAKVNNVQVGPAVTRYELTMPRGISVNKIAQMADDIAMTLASNGAIRVEAPIPGKNSVGIEVPNAQVSPVSLRELIDSEEFKVRQNPLSFVLGKDINGDIIFCNLDKMPHMLVAGSTGSGKSVCLNTMLLSMCYKAGPQDLRLILIDPKMVEFTTYNELPHLLIPEVITGKEMAINALDWAVKEMERRYATFAKNHVVNINEYNKLEAVKTKQLDKLPFIVIVIDELADLMLEAKRELEDRIAKLAAKARAAGIHLVFATQRPSVDVITGTIKANLPSRIAFALTNYMDSRTILDGGGAEKLLGKGDMLFKPMDKPEPRRVQGAYVSNEEIAAVVKFIKDNNKPVYDDDTGRTIRNPHQNEHSQDGVINTKNEEFDPVLKDALRTFIQTKQASASMISRRFSVGFNRAGRIMDQMEQAGFIGPQDGAKPRAVLITQEEFDVIFKED